MAFPFRTTVLLLVASLAVLPIVADLGWKPEGDEDPVWRILALLGAMAGYILPGFVLERRIAKRQRLIQNGLPDALDLFIVCIEAGSSIDQAIVKTSQDLDQSHPILASELRMISTEMRAGKALAVIDDELLQPAVVGLRPLLLGVLLGLFRLTLEDELSQLRVERVDFVAVPGVPASAEPRRDQNGDVALVVNQAIADIVDVNLHFSFPQKNQK